MSKKFAHIRWFFVISIVLLIFFAVAFGREYVANKQIEREIAMLEQDKEALETNRSSTLELIKNLSSEYYLEGEGRTKQGLARAGETVFVIQEQPAAEESEFLKESIQIGNVQGWLYFLFAPDLFEARAVAL